MMESRFKILGHAAHPILIVFPLGLLSTAVVFDVLYLALDKPLFAEVAFWMIVAGLIGGAAAATTGWIDWFAIPSNTRAKRIGLMHGLTNAVVMVLFLVSVILRYETPREPGWIALTLDFVAFALAGFGGWLGGELVERLGVGVDPGAHLNAPNSLSGRPASESAAAAPGETVAS